MIAKRQKISFTERGDLTGHKDRETGSLFRHMQGINIIKLMPCHFDTLFSVMIYKARIVFERVLSVKLY